MSAFRPFDDDQRDTLTALAGRSTFLRRLAHSLQRASRHGLMVAVLFVDLDRFKRVNDTMGHQAGDELIAAAARRICSSVRPGDLVGRFGGDEFTIACWGVTQTKAVAVARRVATALDAPFGLRGTDVRITASIGIAMGDGRLGAEELLYSADTAMYQAKRRGRGGWQVHRVPDVPPPPDPEMTAALRVALARNDLPVTYRRIVSVADGTLRGVDVTAHLDHPQGATVQGHRFEQVAEATGTIVTVTERLLTRVCRVGAALNHGCPDPRSLRVSVKLPGSGLDVPRLAERVAAALAAERLPAPLLCLQLDEGQLLADSRHAGQVLHGVEALGVRLVLNDYGVGYASLGYLRRFPLDAVRVSAELATAVADDSDARRLVAASIGLARSMNLATVGLGIETSDQLRALAELECDEAVGAAALPQHEGLPTELDLSPVTAAAPRPPPPSRSRAQTVLAVDDDPVDLELMRYLLDASGHDPLLASSPSECLDALHDARPALILMDLRMPGRTGVDLMRELKARAPDVPIIAVTGYPDWVTGPLVSEIGFDDVMHKPIDPSEFMQRVTVALHAQD